MNTSTQEPVSSKLSAAFTAMNFPGPYATGDASANNLVKFDEVTTAMLQKQDRSLLGEFLAEARDHCNCAEMLFLELEGDYANSACVDTIFRGLHSIKGAAGFLELTDIRRLAHAGESLLDKVRNNSLTLHAGHIDVLLEACDCVKIMLDGIERAINGGEYTRPSNIDTLVERLQSPMSIANMIDGNSTHNVKLLGEILAENSVVSPEDLQECLLQQSQGDMRKLGAILIAEKGVPVREVASAIAQQKSAKAQAMTDESIRVSVEKLDQVIDIIGEALIMQLMINANPVVQNATNNDLLRSITQMNTIMHQAQEYTMSMRMVKIKPTFQKMARLARDLAKECGKSVEFRTNGDTTEIDKSAVELIADPLMHMVRNAIDHGIEDTAEERLANKKPANATITLRAFHRAGNVCIEITDDGKGLDSQAIFEKAIEKKLAKPDVSYSEKEIFGFIFLPGFSTAKTVTTLSGRGVGMDVVKQNIQALRGSVDIQSQHGHGTTFTIRFPLTLAIINGMIVKTNNQRYILPTLSIVETLRPAADQLSTVVGKGRLLTIRNKLLRLYDLSKIMAVDAGEHAIAGEIVVIVEDLSGKRIGLLVDEIIDQQQVVIKNIGGGLGEIRGVSGAAIMSDGTVNLILDAGSIIAMAGESD